MRLEKNIGFILYLLSFFLMNCKQIYVSPAMRGNNNYLVVDGFIRNGPDSTIIKLSRTANLGDSAGPQPEFFANIVIMGQISGSYPLIDLGNGQYGIDQLNLDVSQNYQLRITTANGRQYASDFVPVRQSPPIDSLHWQTDSAGVTIYLNTHDPQNNTHYYQWDYTQTWEHRVYDNSTVELLTGGVIVPRPLSEEIYRCWSSGNSTNILQTSTSGLSQDLVNEAPLITINNGSEQLSYLYSLFVRQYAITPQAYEYWQNLKQLTELTGTLFDPQPSEVTGNIHSLTNPSEPVLGYVSVSSETSLRIFISNGQLPSWNYLLYNQCPYSIPSIDSLGYYSSFTNELIPIYVTLFNPPLPPATVLALTSPQCADCRFWGGTNIMPSFWPN